MANSHFRDIVWGVERHAIELGVTLLVHGVVISGFLTPYRRYSRWTQEVLGRAVVEGGSAALPPAEMMPISKSEQEAIEAEWNEAIGDGDPGDYESLGVDLGYFCVRNAQIRSGPALQWVAVPYLVVSTAAVDAFVLLHHTAGSLTSGQE